MVAAAARLWDAGEARCSRRRVPMPRQRPQRPKLAARETSLYLPVKRFLESLGFEVKGEICSCDQVWLAVRFSGRRGRERDPRVRKLCRLLGFGLLGVSTSGRVEVLVEPRP